MSFCDVSEVVPKSLMAVIPDRYKGKKYYKVKVGDRITVHDITIVVYNAKKDGDFIVRKDGSYVLNETVYFDIGDGRYTSLRNDKILGQVAQLVNWTETETGEFYYPLDNPENVEIIEINVKYGQKEIPVKAFKSV